MKKTTIEELEALYLKAIELNYKAQKTKETCFAIGAAIVSLLTILKLIVV